MDRLVYIAMTGAKQAFEQQAVTSNNLANASTTAFKAELHAFRALPVTGPGLATRAFVADSTVGADMSSGSMQTTGRDWDVAIRGKGWIAVQAPDGTEAYTRDGSLELSPNGILQTRSGLNVLGDAGPIAIPPDGEFYVGTDGTISTIPNGQTPNTLANIGRIKLVNPPEKDLVRGDDGLFRLKDGSSSPADANVTLASGMLEGSNVNPVQAMVEFINQARSFELNLRLIRTAQDNADQAAKVLSLNA